MNHKERNDQFDSKTVFPEDERTRKDCYLQANRLSRDCKKPLVDARFGVFKNSTGPLENFLEPFQIGGFRQIAPERAAILRWRNSGLLSTGSNP